MRNEPEGEIWQGHTKQSTKALFDFCFSCLHWISGQFHREITIESSQMESVAAEDWVKADGHYQGVAVVSGVLILVAVVYTFAEKFQTSRIQKHWEEVCRQTLQRRNSRKHKMLQRDAFTNQV